MDSFDKKIKNAFEQTNDVPKDFNWESMESGIMTKMEQIVPTPSVPTSLISLKWLGIIGVTAFMGALILYFNNFSSKTTILTNQVTNKNNASENTTTIKNITNKITVSEKILDSEVLDINQANDKNNISDKSNTSDKQITSVSSVPSYTIPTIKKSDNSNQTLNKKTQISNFTTSTNSEKTEIINNSSDIIYSSAKLYPNKTVNSSETKISNDVSFEKNSSLSNSLFESKLPNSNKIDINTTKLQYIKENRSIKTATQGSKENRFIEEINYLSRLSHSLHSNLDKNANIYRKHQAYSKSPVVKTRNSLQFALEINSGINIWNGKYQNTVAMNDYSKKQIGFYNSINAILVNKSWDYKIGYQYEYLNELLDYEKITQEPILFENIPIKTYINSYSDMSYEVNGDTTVIRDRTRKIINYNTIQSHQISLGAARRFQINNKLSWGIDLGVSYTLYSFAKGVSLDNQEQHDIYSNSVINSFGIQTGLNLHYKLGSKLSFISSLSYRQTVGEWNINMFKIRNPGILNLGIGLRYNL